WRPEVPRRPAAAPDGGRRTSRPKGGARLLSLRREGEKARLMVASTAPARSPDPFALTEEERAVRDTAAQFAQRELAPTVAQRDEEERYDRALFDRMGELGLTGLPYPEQYGGAGLGTFPWVLACEEIAAAD